MSGQAAPPEVLVTPLATGGAVLFNLDTRATFTLNATGYRIWRGLAAGSPSEDVAVGLVSAYAVDAERARASVARLQRDLRAAGLLADG